MHTYIRTVDIHRALLARALAKADAAGATAAEKRWLETMLTDLLPVVCPIPEAEQSLRPHLADNDRTVACWCGADIGEPHKVTP